MKKRQFFSVAVAAVLLSACSNDEVLDTTGGSQALTPGGNAYVSISLNVPNTTTGTRFLADPSQDENKDFNDGSADESKVKSATLLVFAGPNADDATYSQKVDLA
ncbi:MAG: hypothetical protein LUC45_05295 [Paraprevotella sp.]|nr:hypothetical protein [Paraprevotella sp.]